MRLKGFYRTIGLLLEVMKPGRVPGYGGVHLRGYSDSIPTSFQTVWPHSTGLVWLSGTNTFTIESDSALDDPTSTGLHEVEITGLTGSGEETETVVLNGTTPVALVNSYRLPFINIEGTVAGSGDENAGNILIKNSGNVHGYIAAGDNNSLSMAYRAPGGNTALIVGANVWTSSADTSFRLRCQPNGGLWQTDLPIKVPRGSSTIELNLPDRMNAGDRFELQAKVGVGTGSVSASFNIMEIKNA